MAIIRRTQPNIDTQDVNLNTQERVNELAGDVYQTSEEQKLLKEEQYLKDTQAQQGPQADLMGRNAYGDAMHEIAGESSFKGPEDMGNYDEATNQNSSFDLNSTWSYQVAQSFNRGVGQTIASNGDLINMVASVAPFFDMANGTLLGNFIKDAGESVENEHMTQLKEQMLQQKVDWNSLASVDFYTTTVAEQIPLMIEMLATGYASGAAAEATAQGLLNNKFVKKQLAGVFGKSTKTVANLARKSTQGVESFTDLAKSGSGLAGQLVRDIDGVKKLTNTGKAAANFVGAGLSNNLMSGAINGMQLHQTMKEDNERAKANGKEPIYSDEDMANAAAGTVANNMAYLPIDIISWGISYGRGLEKLGKGFSKTQLKTAEEIAKASSTGFRGATAGVLKNLAKVTGHAVAEGWEEQYQEVFENWAAQRAKEKQVGFWKSAGDLYTPGGDFWDYYQQEDQMATKVISAATGGLFGGVGNLKTFINGNAENALNFQDANEMLRNSVDAKEGKQWQEKHIYDHMVNIYGSKMENKADMFNGFMEQLVEDGVRTEEEVQELSDTFNEVGEAFETADGLNILGKQALVNNLVTKKYLEKSMANGKEQLMEKLKSINEQFPEDSPQKTKLINDEVKAYDEDIKAKSVLATMAEQNKLNLISGKEADPLNMQFIISRTGKERLVLPEFIADFVNDENFGKAGIFAGLSAKQYEEYVAKSDDQIYEDAKKANIQAIASLKNKGLFRKILDKFKFKKEVELDEDGNPLPDVEQATDEYAEQVTKDAVEKTVSNIELQEQEPTMSEQEVDSLTKVQDDLEAKDKLTPEEEVQLKETKEKLANNEEAIARNEAIDKANQARKKNPQSTEGQNSFEQKAVEQGFKKKGTKTIQQDKSDREAEAKKEFEKQTQEELDKENGKKEIKSTNYKPVKNNDGKFTVVDEATNEPLKNSSGEIRTFQKEGPAKAAATVANRKANTSGKASKPLTASSVKQNAQNAGKKIVSGTKSIIAKAAAEAAEMAKGQEGMSAQGIWNQTKKVGKAIGSAIVGGVKGAAEMTIKEISEQQKRNAVNQNNKQDSLRRKIIAIHQQYKADIPTTTVKVPNGRIEAVYTTQGDIGPVLEGQVQQRVQGVSFDPAYDEKIVVVGKSLSPSVSKSDLDAYLNSSISKVTWAPAIIHKQLALNNYLKKLGIKTDVVYASNLFTAVGEEAVGYALASTVYIDEKIANQIPVFMHEMTHINYRTTKDSEATKQAIKFAQRNTKLVEQIKATYPHLIKYRFVTSEGEVQHETLFDMLVKTSIEEDKVADALAELEKYPAEQILAEAFSFEDDATGMAHMPMEAPMEFQDGINEELFAFTMEGELSEKYNDYFQPIKEKERVGHVRSWLKWLNNLHIKYADNKEATLNLLNNKKKIPKTDLYDFITEEFPKQLAKRPGVATTQGFASRVLSNNAKAQQERQAISDEKVAQQEAYDPEEGMRREANNFYAKTLAKIKKNIDSGNFSGGQTLTDKQIETATAFAIDQMEKDMEEGGAYDDFEMMGRSEMKGATRILNNFVKSYNYVKRMRFQKRNNKTQGEFDEKNLLDRDELISTIAQLAIETKGNSNEFIRLIEKSPLREVAIFNDYMDEIYGGQKKTYLNSMALILSNTQTIQAIKSYVNPDGTYSYESALSMTERNKVNARLNNLFTGQHDYYKQKFNKDEEPTPSAQAFQEYKISYDRIKNGTQNASDYTTILDMLSPYGTDTGAIINDGFINMKGASINIKTFIDNLVKSGALESKTGKRAGRFNAVSMKPFVEAIADTNRKFTSYSVVENAEGHMQPTKITNNNLLNVVNDMNEFMANKKNTFAGFKRRFANITSDTGKRTLENPLLRGLWDNYKDGSSRVSISQYLGLKHDQSGKSNMYQESTDFTQTMEDFLMFNNGDKKISYQHNLGAFADSPRKFMISAKKLKFDENFIAGDKGGSTLSIKGSRQLENAFNVYADLNKKVDPSEKMNTLEEFKQGFYDNIKKEIETFNQHGADLVANKTLVKKGVIDPTTKNVTLEGKKRIAEFVLNNVVNGLAAAEIFNPGVRTNDVSKRNKGNGSPVFTIGNKNVRMEAIPVNDTNVETKTNSGMYMTDTMANKIIAAGKGVFDMNHGLKLLNFHTEKDNENFRGRSAYFKGYTTIISEKTLETEPGLRGIYELLKAREAKFENEFFKKNGKFPSADLMDGNENYINYAVPYSAIKSDFLTAEQAKEMEGLTYDALNEDAENNGVDGMLAKEGSTHQKVNAALDKMYYGKKGFIGLSMENFGPQQIMDKVTKESTTPVQFIASVIVNGSGESLKLAEEIQSLIRKDMDANFEEVVKELKGMNPKAYKDFILKSLDLENMDQSQRLIIEENMTNLNHPAVADFVNNTLARKLKMSANRLKTNGTIAQQKPNHFYRIKNGWTTMNPDGNGFSGEIRGYSDRITKDGRTGSGALEIVLPMHMNDGHIKARKYITADSEEALHSVQDLPELANQLKSADEGVRMAALKDVAMSIARDRFRKSKSSNPNAMSIEDYIGRFYDAEGKPVGYFVRGDNVIASRIPSHGPASSGVFEVIDFSQEQGNQAIVSDEWSDTAGSDYDGDSLFIQTKGKKGKTPNFDLALEKTVELYTSPEMYEQIRAKIEFKDKIEGIMKRQKTVVNKAFPMSPEFNREAYNNTMISKRNIGIALNMNRIANYLATYKVGLAEPIYVDGKKIEMFQDGITGTESRNNQSAMLANIILDNAKWHYADALGLNEQTVNQFSLLVNMGMSLEDVSKIMNSRAIKTLNKYSRNNESPYLIKRRGQQVNDLVAKELGLSSIKSKNTSLNIDIDKLIKNDSQQEQNVIALMNYLDKINSDVLKVSRIMAGHKGVENNPFVLEQQIKDFENVVSGKTDKPVLIFNAGFKNNPDIAAYHKNAETILGIMQKANKIYRKSTSELVSKLNEKLGWDDSMDETQMKRVSDVVKRFVNSRMLGLNNLTAEKKEQMKTKLFDELAAYEVALKTTYNADPKKNPSSRKESLLFTRALNINFGYDRDANNNLTYKNAYVSANPNFFNESLGVDEKAIIQREFQELPQSIKDGMIVLDLMKNGLTGNLSLANIFDEDLNHMISNMATIDQMYKDRPIAKKVMDQLENIIVTNEFNQEDGKISNVVIPGTVSPDEVLSKLSETENAKGLYNSIKNGKGTYFKINGKPYVFEGATKEQLGKAGTSAFSNKIDQTVIDALLQNKIHPYETMEGDMNLEAISIPDKDVFKPMKTKESTNTDGAVDYIVRANQTFKKKSSVGKASSLLTDPKQDYYNQIDETPLTKQTFDLLMGYINGVSDTQKEGVYLNYLKEKKEANELFADKYSPKNIAKMTDEQIYKVWASIENKDMYAYANISTALGLTMANRKSVEQVNLTGVQEDGKDISLLTSLFESNNIDANHPTTQALIREINTEYKKFSKARAKYVKDINVVTDALYTEKFKLSDNKIIRFGQRIYTSFMRDRGDVYKRLYGNLIEINTINLEKGKTAKEYKLKDRATINAMYNAKQISDAEYAFYNVFQETTNELYKFDPRADFRKDYIPHTAMDTMEMYSSRGLLGLFVNSKGSDELLSDVKVYSPGTTNLVSFSDIKNNYNAVALEDGNRNSIKRIREYYALEKKAKKLLKEGKNEDGSQLEFSNIQNATLLDMSPMSRFSNSRSVKSTVMPSMDLNKALVDYVHTSLFTNGNKDFKGFKKMMPLIDGAVAYNDKMGYKNAFNYVKEVFKDGFIQHKDQKMLGKTGDKIVNGMVVGNLIYALGYKGMLIGKGIYAVGNVVAGKYMNIKREGGKQWLTGELRYWGTDKGFGLDALKRRKRAQNILSNLGYLDIDMYDQVSIEKKSGLDGIFTNLALLPMTQTEGWIQKAHMLGMLSEDEMELFDDEGNYKTGAVQITEDRILKLEERVKMAHGKGFTPIDQSRAQQYSLGRMFLQFSRHIPAQLNERFGKESVDVNGTHYVGSLRQVGIMAHAVMTGEVKPNELKAYYGSLKPHEKNAFDSAMRGAAMMALFGFVYSATDNSGDKLSANHIAGGAISDANIQFDADRAQFKAIPPAMRSLLATTHNMINGSGENDE